MHIHLLELHSSHPVIGCGDHQSVWHQDGRFGLLDVSDGHDWDGNLGWAGIRRNNFECVECSGMEAPSWCLSCRATLVTFD